MQVTGLPPPGRQNENDAVVCGAPAKPQGDQADDQGARFFSSHGCQMFIDDHYLHAASIGIVADIYSAFGIATLLPLAHAKLK